MLTIFIYLFINTDYLFINTDYLHVVFGQKIKHIFFAMKKNPQVHFYA